MRLFALRAILACPVVIGLATAGLAFGQSDSPAVRRSVSPKLKALESGFQAGTWTIARLGSDRPELKRCVRTSDWMLTAGRNPRQCTFTVIADNSSDSVVTYRCQSGLSGRTALRRDTGGLFTVDAQGVDEQAKPFGSRTEWRHVGGC